MASCYNNWLNVNVKSEILAIFADLNHTRARHGDPMQHPVFLRLGDMEREHGGSMREPLQDAISETKYRAACVSGIHFLGELPGSSRFLADMAVNHDDDWYRSAAVESLEQLGEREMLRDVYDRAPTGDRERIGRTLVYMDAELLGDHGQLTSRLLRGMHPGKCLDEFRAKFGEARSLALVRMIRDHPQLPESVRPTVNDVCSGCVNDAR